MNDSPAHVRASAIESIRRARHLFVDWDGCLVERGVLRRGAYPFLRRFGDRISVLSNNSTDTPERLSRFLERHGVHVPPEQFFLAGDVTLRQVAMRIGRQPVYLLANGLMRDHARSLGLRSHSRAAREVVLLRDTTFTYERLERAVHLLHSGRPLVVANPDVTHPRGGGVAPETGALLAAIASCVDLRRVDVSIVGKPGPTLFRRALAACGCGVDEVAMIGDGAQTDVAGAERIGMPSVLIDDEAGMTLSTVVKALVTSGSGHPSRHDVPQPPARRVKSA